MILAFKRISSGCGISCEGPCQDEINDHADTQNVVAGQNVVDYECGKGCASEKQDQDKPDGPCPFSIQSVGGYQTEYADYSDMRWEIRHEHDGKKDHADHCVEDGRGKHSITFDFQSGA